MLIVLVAAAVVLVVRALFVMSHEHGLEASLAAPVPRSLLTTAPVRTAAPVAGGASASARKTRQPSPPATKASGSSSPTTSTQPAPIVHPIRPTRIFIPSIGVNRPVHAAPTEYRYDEFVGHDVPSFGVPPDTARGMQMTTWWSDGSEPGAPPPHYAIILGHTQIDGPGVFNDLAKLRQGDIAGLTDGHILLKFRVIGKPRTGIPKTDPKALQKAIEHHPPGTRLVLLTCSGHFNGRESVDNTAVFLTLVGAGAAGQ